MVGGITGTSNGVQGNGSSLTTSAQGTAAWAQLLGQRGVHVEQLTSPLDTTPLMASSTLLCLDPINWSAADGHSVASFVRSGGTVVVSGPSAPAALRDLDPAIHVVFDNRPVGIARSQGTSHFINGVERVDSKGVGAFEVESGSPTTLLAGAGGVEALAIHDQGWLVALASSSPLRNSLLATDDDAAFGLDLAGVRGSTAVFDEYAHGVGTAGSGLSGLPGSWRWGLGALFAALLVWIVSASRRLGAPQARERAALPPRIQYVDAMATLLDARPDSEINQSAEPLRRALRIALARRYGVQPDETTRLRALAEQDGTVVSAEALDLLESPCATADDAVVLAQALASVSGSSRSLQVPSTR
jgi:hypothetical protein